MHHRQAPIISAIIGKIRIFASLLLAIVRSGSKFCPVVGETYTCAIIRILVVYATVARILGPCRILGNMEYMSISRLFSLLASIENLCCYLDNI